MQDFENFVGELNYNVPPLALGMCIVNYIKKLPYNESVNYSVYLYGKEDIVQYNLPAIIVKVNDLSSSQTGFLQHMDVNIEILRNKSVQNRTSEFFQNQMAMERTIQSITNTTDFLAVISRDIPYLNFIGEKYRSRYLADNSGVEVSFRASYLFNYYKRYIDSGNYYPTGEYKEVFTPTEVKTIVTVGGSLNGK